MQIMKVFGAPLMLRSGVLFRVALIDAIISSFLTSGAFLALKYRLVSDDHIEILSQKQNLLFQSADFLILISASILRVRISVSLVVFGNKE
jgi:cell division transport system permease protein